MPKTVVFTTITPLPAGITRKSVLDMYRDHLVMIDLNPLVVERFKCKPPGYAPTDEYWSTWYTIKDKVSYLPGGLAQGSVSYHACFNDVSDGLQTHVYAPLGLDIQGKWSVGGRLPGEPMLSLAESGLNVPRHGLYIREDVKMTCSSLLLGFVKRTFKDSHSRLVEKLVEQAHIRDANLANERLQALRNVDPGERMDHGEIFIAPPPDYQFERYHHVLTPAPNYMSHNRSQSEPVRSPGFSSFSTLVDQSQSPLSPDKNDNRPASFRFILEEKPIWSSAPEPKSMLLPTTTYDGGFSKRHERATSLYPGSPSDQYSERVISLRPSSPYSPYHARKEPISDSPPRLSYTPEELPISFTFPLDPRSPSVHKSTFEATDSKQIDILQDINVAIDEVFMYTLPANMYGTIGTTTLPATLPSTSYSPKHVRKDSVGPYHPYSDAKLPPVPLKDEKYRKVT